MSEKLDHHALLIGSFMATRPALERLCILFFFYFYGLSMPSIFLLPLFFPLLSIVHDDETG